MSISMECLSPQSICICLGIFCLFPFCLCSFFVCQLPSEVLDLKVSLCACCTVSVMKFACLYTDAILRQGTLRMKFCFTEVISLSPQNPYNILL